MDAIQRARIESTCCTGALKGTLIHRPGIIASDLRLTFYGTPNHPGELQPGTSFLCSAVSNMGRKVLCLWARRIDQSPSVRQRTPLVRLSWGRAAAHALRPTGDGRSVGS